MKEALLLGSQHTKVRIDDLYFVGMIDDRGQEGNGERNCCLG